MDQARRDHLRQLQQRRWNDCRRLSTLLNIAKEDINFYLYKMIVDNGLLEQTLADDPSAIAQITASAEWQRMITRPERQRIVTEDEEEETPPSNADLIKMALWLIRKAGSVERAKKAISVAGAALSKLENDEPM